MALNEITKGMSNAAEQINGNFNQLAGCVEDTGWIDLTPTENADVESAKYRVKSGLMFFMIKTYLASSSSTEYLFELPSMYEFDPVNGIVIDSDGLYLTNAWAISTSSSIRFNNNQASKIYVRSSGKGPINIILGPIVLNSVTQ